MLGAVYRGKVSGIMEFGCFVEVQGFGHLGKKVGTCCPFLLQTCRNSNVNAYNGCAVAVNQHEHQASDGFGATGVSDDNLT